MAELVVVLAILAILTAVSVPSLFAYARSATLRAGAEELVAARARYHVGTCSGAAWTGVGTDADGTIRLANGVRVSGADHLCFNYLGAGSATPAPCAANGTLTVAHPSGGGTMSVIMATTGRVRIQ